MKCALGMFLILASGSEVTHNAVVFSLGVICGAALVIVLGSVIGGGRR